MVPFLHDDEKFFEKLRVNDFMKLSLTAVTCCVLFCSPCSFGQARPDYAAPAVKHVIDTHIHLYGKKLTKPFRKMGHITLVDKDVESLRNKVNLVKNTLKIIA